MDAYLEIAERVLRAARRPLSAKAILDAAFQAGIVPEHLHGQSQHKTLQARLSEYILEFKKDGIFFRTEPGVFFLTEFESDPEIPEKHKEHFSARRRTRDLFRAPALAFNRRFIEECQRTYFENWTDLISEASDAGAIKYVDPRSDRSDYLPVWSFSVVRRAKQVLSYRIGRYRDDRDSFALRKSIGFPAMVSYFDQSLFSQGDMGASECGLRAILTDLDISTNSFRASNGIVMPSISFALFVHDLDVQPSLLFVMDWICPDWFEPTMRRLSLNDPTWMDIAVAPNDVDDFEPWSVAALGKLQQRATAS